MVTDHDRGCSCCEVAVVNIVVGCVEIALWTNNGTILNHNLIQVAEDNVFVDHAVAADGNAPIPTETCPHANGRSGANGKTHKYTVVTVPNGVEGHEGNPMIAKVEEKTADEFLDHDWRGA